MITRAASSRSRQPVARPSEPPSPAYEGPWYAIDPAWYEQQGVSLEAAVHARRCPSCLVASTKKDAKPTSRSSRAPAKGKAPALSGWQLEMHELAEDCAHKQDYVTADTPLIESVFRTLLANENRPTAFQQLVAQISQRYAVGEMPKDVAPSALERLLAKQQTYGIKRVESSA